MAKTRIPDVTALGGRPVPRQGGGSATYDANSGMERAPGEAAAQLGEQTMRLGAQSFRTAEDLLGEIKKEEDKVNTLRAEEAYNKLLEKKHELTFGEGQGFMFQRGTQAVAREKPLNKEYGERFEQSTSDIEAGLSNDAQRQRFRQRALVAKSAFDEDIFRHLAKESDTYAKEVYDATITTSLRDATAQWDSPNDVGMALLRVERAVAERGERYSWPEDYRKAVLQQEHGKIHSAVVKQALATGNYLFAQEYGNAHKGDVDPATAATIAKAVEDGSQKQLAAGYRAKYLEVQNSLPALKSLHEQVLNDKGLDDTRRNVQVGQIQTQMARLEHKQELAYERNMRRIERGVSELNANTLAGFEPSPEQFAPFIAAAKGTELEQTVRSAVTLANATRQFRSLPPVQQENMLAGAEAGIRENPTKFDRRIVGAWRQIYDAQREQVQKSPITFAVRQGLVDPLQPLDLTQPNAIGPAMQQRFEVARSMTARYQAPFKPLTPEEQTLLTSTLRKMGPDQKRTYLSGLAQAAGTDYEGYSAIMGQLAADDPATAVAGQYAFRGRTQAADLILGGQPLLHPNKREDGTPDKGKLWPMPPETDLRKGFQSYEKDAFAGYAGARNAMFQSSLAIYAKLSADEGDATGVLNSNRWDKSIRLATGGIERYNGKATVLPYGYEFGQFKDGLAKRIDQITTSGRLGTGMNKSRLLDLPLEPVGDGRYMFRGADGLLLDKDRKPIVVDFNTSLPFNTSGSVLAAAREEPTEDEIEAAAKPATGRAKPKKKQ